MSLRLTIPVIAEKRSPPGEASFYRAAPIFFGSGVAADGHAGNSGLGGSGDSSGANLEGRGATEARAIAQLTDQMRRALAEEAVAMRHDRLARWSFSPELELRRLPLVLRLRRQTMRAETLVASFEAFAERRRIAIVPAIPGLSFELARGETLAQRAEEVLASHFRDLEREGAAIDEEALVSGSARLVWIDLEARASQRYRSAIEERFAILGGSQPMSGPEELEKTGRCLNRVLSGGLGADGVAILREAETEELAAHFREDASGPVPEPLTLVGPNLVGKSCLVRALVARELAEAQSGDGKGGARRAREYWLLSPQRLISGMSYVGQWEDRVHAILREARARGHVLVFDDLPGLFQAGRSRDSDLTVGQVLKAYLEEGKLRVLAEATPGAWRRLREIDRGFADLFRAMPLREPSEAESLRIAVRSVQGLELRHDCRFAAETLPLAMQLQRRFSRSRALPGKVVQLLEQLAHRASPGEAVDAEALYRFYETKTGIRRSFLAREPGVSRAEATGFFSRRVLAQPEAVEAMVDAVVACAAQMNDPGRPLASLLFLGPTGVGKTECAKALAAYVFGSEERLLRFDLNEYGGGDAVSRLVGDRYRPQGQLTAALRRQPHAVLLLDEIEKAHPSVFDLLLQLLGDGRLTDAQGETADFSACIVVMTSNLGARDARQRLGFGSAAADGAQVYREAAERFFRPELFNRFDRVVGFRELGREAVRELAASLAAKVLERPGAEGRGVSFSLAPEAEERLAEIGFLPEYGARALRRAIEEHLAEPLATRLGELPASGPTAVRVAFAADGGLDLSVSRFVAPRQRTRRLAPLGPAGAERLVSAANRFLRRAEDRLAERGGAAADGTYDPLDPARAEYFALREEVAALRQVRDRLAAAAETERRTPPGRRRPPARFGRGSTGLSLPAGRLAGAFEEFAAARHPAAWLVSLLDEAEVASRLAWEAEGLVARANRLERLLRESGAAPERVVLRLRTSAGEWSPAMRRWAELAFRWLRHPTNLDAAAYRGPGRSSGGGGGGGGGGVLLRPDESRPSDWDGGYDPATGCALLCGAGPALLGTLGAEAGASLFVGETAIEHGLCEVFPLREGEDPLEVCERLAAEPAQAVLAGEVEVLRAIVPGRCELDFRTDRLAQDGLSPWSEAALLEPSAEEFREFYEAGEGLSKDG